MIAIPDVISISDRMRPSCSYRVDDPKHVVPAAWLYSSPGMGQGPTVGFICDECKTEIVRMIPAVKEFFATI